MHTTVAAGALVLVSLAVASPAQQAAGVNGDVRLAGRIVSVSHEGVPAAEVWATDTRGKVLGRTVADGDGFYRLARLPLVPLRVHARGGDKVAGRTDVDANGLVREATVSGAAQAATRNSRPMVARRWVMDAGWALPG